MAKEYAARFWRYENGRAKISGPVRLVAEDFNAAHDQAQLVLSGMIAIVVPNVFVKARETIIELHSVVCTASSVTPCEGRLNIWEMSDHPADEAETDAAVRARLLKD